MKVFLIGGTNGGKFVESTEKIVVMPRIGSKTTEEYFVDKLRVGDTQRYFGLITGMNLVDGIDRLIERY